MKNIHIYNIHKIIIAACTFVLLSAYNSTPVAAQTSNATCRDAIEVTGDDTSYYFIAGSLFSATPSGEDLPRCEGREQAQTPDIWYTFTASSTTHQLMVAPCAACFDVDLDFALYSGTCDNLTLIKCSTSPVPHSPETDILNGLTVGTTYYVRVYAYQTSDYFNPSEFQFGVRVPPPEASNSIQRPGFRPQLKTYPIPFTDELTVVLPQDISSGGTLHIYDLNGRLVEEIPIHQLQLVIPTSEWPPGMYAYRYITDHDIIHGKLIKE